MPKNEHILWLSTSVACRIATASAPAEACALFPADLFVCRAIALAWPEAYTSCVAVVGHTTVASASAEGAQLFDKCKTINKKSSRAYCTCEGKYGAIRPASGQEVGHVASACVYKDSGCS